MWQTYLYLLLTIIALALALDANSSSTTEGVVSSKIEVGLLQPAPTAKPADSKVVENSSTTGEATTVETTLSPLKLSESAANLNFPFLQEEAHIGGACASDEFCKNISNSHCKEGICECLDEYVRNFDGSNCLRIASKLGDACELRKQCEHLEGKCEDGVCVERIRAVEKSAVTEPLPTLEPESAADGSNSASMVTETHTVLATITISTIIRLMQ